LHLKQRERSLDEAGYVESFLVLNVVGGDCLESFDQLHEAAQVERIPSHRVPSAETARKFLYRSHAEAKIEQAQQERLPIAQRACAALPETVEQRYFRGDSTCDEEAF
jgi:hypothetical protein